MIEPAFRFINADKDIGTGYNFTQNHLVDTSTLMGWNNNPLLITDDGSVLRYGETVLRVLAFAGRLRGAGIQKGDRVLLHGFNSREVAIAWFALIRIGAVVVCSMPVLREHELQQYIEIAHVSAAIWDRDVPAAPERALAALDPDRIVYLHEEGVADPIEAALSEGHVAPPVETDADTICIIAFTSGTTGVPKATTHRHRDLKAVWDHFGRQVLRPVQDDLFACSAPFGFTYGLGGLLLFPTGCGAACLLSARGGARNLADSVDRLGATILLTSPQFYRAMLKEESPPVFASLRLCVSAGEVLPADVHRCWREKFGKDIINGIGSTEMLHIFLASRPERGKFGTVGVAVPGYEVRVVDDFGIPCPGGVQGVLQVRGPTGCQFLDASLITRYVRDGWNVTGDLATMDADGDIVIHGRIDDLINYHGFKIDPVEVETCIDGHSAIEACAVVGTVEALGQTVAAFVVPRLAMDDAELEGLLVPFLRERLASYKIPRKFVAVSELPRTTSGKLKRHALKAVAT